MAVTKKTDNSVDKDVEQLQSSYTAGRNIKL